LNATERAAFIRGELVVGQSGCEACHEIGTNGNNGPGPPLTRIGKKDPPAAIASTLRNPTPPMPSFRNLPTKKFNDLVEFLSLLQ
jgi:ubiquinol-cytochrome c reductase cytochrome b subunit/menaquinol-cytochrome c reductase cytochrome b/c subunit